MWAKNTINNEVYTKTDYYSEVLDGTGKKYIDNDHLYTYTAGKGIAFPTKHLWSGTMNMHGGQTVTPSKNINECRNGWILMWTKYSGGVQTFADIVEVYISKSFVSTSSGGGARLLFGGMGNVIIHKYLTINPSNIVGNAQNTTGDAQKSVLVRVHEW